MAMIHSAGAVLYTVISGERRYVLVREKNGSYGLPKGHVEPGETLAQTALREVREETGLTLTSYRYRGIITFASDRWETEYMHLFTADGFTGELCRCDEGDLEWVDDDKVAALPTWEGDRVFLDLIARDVPFFSLKLVYDGDVLQSATLNGKTL